MGRIDGGALCKGEIAIAPHRRKPQIATVLLDIEQLGISSSTDGGNTAETKARAAALGHLKSAANDLPEVAEAQARYGVALILSRETELGRVYLQRAAGLGHLAPRSQIWISMFRLSSARMSCTLVRF